MKTILTAKRLFLIDAIGALFTAAGLFIILSTFEAAIGMPRNILYVLLAIAFLFSVYSWSCFLWVNKNKGFFLRIIAVANLLYGCVTVFLLLYLNESIKPLGYLYFIGEILIIGILVSFEWKVARQEQHRK